MLSDRLTELPEHGLRILSPDTECSLEHVPGHTLKIYMVLWKLVERNLNHIHNCGFIKYELMSGNGHHLKK